MPKKTTTRLGSTRKELPRRLSRPGHSNHCDKTMERKPKQARGKRARNRAHQIHSTPTRRSRKRAHRRTTKTQEKNRPNPTKERRRSARTTTPRTTSNQIKRRKTGRRPGRRRQKMPTQEDAWVGIKTFVVTFYVCMCKIS